MSNYDAIFEWKMTEQEGETYKLAITWEEQTKKVCPECKLAKLPKRSDPRKSNLFRQCWKLLRETRGLLKPNEYKMYIIANIQIIVANNGRLEPNALCGEKAWIRWKVWKRLYDRKVLVKQGEAAPPKLVIDPKVIKDLDCTKKFLFEKCDGEPTLSKIKTFFDKGKMSIWAGGKISYFYLVLSPWVASFMNPQELGKNLGFDPKVYEQKVSDDVRKLFQIEYDYEFL